MRFEGFAAHGTLVELFAGIVVEHYSMRHESGFEVELFVANFAAVHLIRLLPRLLLEHDALLDVPLDNVLSLKPVQRRLEWIVLQHMFQQLLVTLGTLVANIANIWHGIFVVVSIYMIQHYCLSFKHFVTMYTNNPSVPVVLFKVKLNDIGVLPMECTVTELTDPPAVVGAVLFGDVRLNASQ